MENKVLLLGSKNKPQIEMFSSFAGVIESIRNKSNESITFESTIETGQIILISGNSYPENILETYQNFHSEFNQLLREKVDIVLIICFEMFNTGTSKFIGTIINNCRSYKEQGGNVEVFWLAIDEEYKNAGEDYQSYCKDKESEVIQIVELFSNWKIIVL